MARKLLELLDLLNLLDSGELKAQEFSKLARSLIKTPDSLSEGSGKQ
jgi:hypothetical protein